MPLRDRFEYLNFGRKPSAGGTDLTPLPPFPAGKGGAESGGAALDRLRERAVATPPWLARFEALGGTHEPGPAGTVHVVRRRHAADHEHGERRLDDFLGLSPGSLATLGRDEALAGVPLDGVVFLDCETTGLAGGTGTKAFLVGLAYFMDGPNPPAPLPHGEGGDRGPGARSVLVVEQHFLSDYDAEGAFLAGLGETLERFEWLVTFNGKTFDLPLLDTRLALARRPADWLDLPHLDLLHPARRIWRRRLESCSLSSLEANLFGLSREGDVPGWLIPSLYFSFLANGDLRPLEPVFEHNRLDLLSLVTLAVRLGRLVDGAEEPEHPLDRYSLGRLLEDVGEAERAVAAYEAALAGDLSAAEREEVGFRLGRLYKRLRRDEAALDTWRSLAAEVGDKSLEALVELAKHHEHRARDYVRAAEATRRALVALALRPEAAAGEMSVAALEKRLRRLEARLTRDRQES